MKEKAQWRTESIQTLTTISDDAIDMKKVHNNPVVITSNNKPYTSRHNNSKTVTAYSGNNRQHNKHGDNNNFTDNISIGVTSEETSPTQPSYRSDSFMSATNKTLDNTEPRIVAPNVSKLSPQSVIEVRLQSLSEIVAILCSVDVLKMRSGFFHQVLAEQERHRLNKSVTSSSDNIWREPITIPETSPYEAAAFLESLHEGGRSISKGDWNYCWTRLSVNWITEDLAIEYGQQIEFHIQKLCTLVSDNNWRTNPQVLTGMRIAAFKKGPTPVPTIAIGTVIDATNSTPYSKVRVSFDTDKGNPAYNVLNTFNLSSPRPPSTLQSQDINIKNDVIVGEISEPFWIQSSKDSPWMEPDEFFYNEAKRLINSNDKRIFWEMVRAIIEMPELSARCKSARIKDQKDLANMFKKPEYKILWTSDASNIVPKEAAAELITAAYVIAPANVDA